MKLVRGFGGISLIFPFLSPSATADEDKTGLLSVRVRETDEQSIVFRTRIIFQKKIILNVYQ